MSNVFAFFLFFIFVTSIFAGNQSRRLGKLHTLDFSNYYSLGLNAGKYSSSIEYPDLSCVGAVYSDSGMLGTGTLIAPNIVVTAAHVLKNSSSAPTPTPSEWKFILHSNFDRAPASSKYEIEKIVIHPSWIARLPQMGGAGDGDILGVDLALLFLKQNITQIYPAKLNYGNTEKTGERVVLSGYGSLADGVQGVLSTQNDQRLGGENILDRVVEEVDAPHVVKTHRGGILAIDFDAPQANSNSLGANLPVVDYLGDGNSSASPLSLESSTAVGDSGGPIFIWTDGAWRAVGTVSYGTADSQYGDITVYTRLASQIEWIQAYFPKFAQARDLGVNGWKELDWFGSFFSLRNNWSFHQLHGWFYNETSNGESFWGWQDNHLGWWWACLSLYPYIYSDSLQSWLFIDVEYSTPGNLIYFNYDLMSWNRIVNSP